MSKFAELSKINVNAYTEKKNGLTYLSWAWAVDQLLRYDPTATWEYRWVSDKPYVLVGETCMVFCTVKAFGVERTAQLPVMDHRNRAIPSPDAFQVNVAMQRCLAKAIALHGIGLYIYAGEDLPEGEPKAVVASPGVHSPSDGCFDALTPAEQDQARTIAANIVDLWEQDKAFAAYEAFYEAGLDNEMQRGIWELLRPNSKVRNGIKKISDENKRKVANG